MKDIQLVEFKKGMKNYLEAITKCSMSYVASDEFKKSQYDLYTAHDLLEAINSEEREEVRQALIFMLHYKTERNLFKASIAFKSSFSRY